MRSLTVLAEALEIVEQRLCEPMNAADLARACFVSYSGLQKLFNYAFGCSVSMYITKRRLSHASKELLSGKKIIDIALQYQYESPEAFSRAFRRFWGISPSEFRKTRRFTELHPRFVLEYDYGGITMSRRKPIDITELYDELKKLGGTYAFGVDTDRLMYINDQYGFAAGDIAIAETFARIERELSDDMLLFRTGGDEFAVLTGYSNLEEAEALARRITARNGEMIKSGEHELPLSISVGITKVPTSSNHFKDAISYMNKAIDNAKRNPERMGVFTPE